MNQAHKRATIELKAAQARFTRRHAERDGTLPAEKAYQAAKHALADARAEWRRTRPPPPHLLNGDGVATPSSIRLTSRPKGGS